MSPNNNNNNKMLVGSPLINIVQQTLVLQCVIFWYSVFYSGFFLLIENMADSWTKFSPSLLQVKISKPSKFTLIKILQSIHLRDPYSPSWASTHLWRELSSSLWRHWPHDSLREYCWLDWCCSWNINIRISSFLKKQLQLNYGEHEFKMVNGLLILFIV